jgi:hypothetical protein
MCFLPMPYGLPEGGLGEASEPKSLRAFFLGAVGSELRAFASHLGGLPRLFPPAANRSRAARASRIRSNSSRNSAMVLSRSWIKIPPNFAVGHVHREMLLATDALDVSR